VSQFGVGDDQDVALFNAGDEGDAFKIDSSGNSHFYKEVDIVKENDVSFDTILIRRTDATSVYMNLRTLQVYANNINILPSATNATQSFESGSLGDVIEFMTWNDLVAQVSYRSLTYYASNIRNNNVTDPYVVHSDNSEMAYVSLYIPLTQSFNISDIQSFVLYNRLNAVQDRINGFRIELYNRSNGFTPGTNVLYSMPINTTANVYRFDLPAITSYTGGFSTTDSQTQIKDITVSASTQNFYTTLLKVEGGNTELGGDLSVSGNVDISGSLNVETSLTTNQLIVNVDIDLYFDTIVIRRPTGVGTGQFTGIREVQLFVNNVNVLPDLVSQSTFNVDGTPLQDISNIPFFIDWSDKTLDPHHVHNYPSNAEDENFGTTAYWGMRGVGSVYNTDIGLYIPMSDKINIKDIQSAIIYNRANGNDNFIGCAIELYNRSNDPNLETPLSSTNLITTADDVYRFDYPAIDTYPSGDFSDTDSISQIASETLALKEVVKFANGNIIMEGTLRANGNIIMGGILQVNRIKGNSNEFNKANISIVFNFNDNLHFFKSSTNSSVGYIQDDTNVGQIDFTGQHRCFIKDLPFSNTDVYEGRIVCADQNTNITISGSIKKGNQAITQNETLPYVSLSVKNNDKSCFGVISASEDPNERVDRYGSFCTPFEKEKGDTRVYINSVGEGAIWVSNKNGELESGDYITTCDLLGYGVKQDDDVLHNYTVAKITMDCDFNPRYVPRPTILKDENGENILDPYEQIQWTDEVDASGNIVYEYEYNIRYINSEAQIIPYEEYIDNSNNAYIVAYVGCTYHCG